jgi:thymidylate kinase
MSKIIAITGTHGTGKTTLTFCLAMHYKQQGANVKIIQEVARSCPFPLNDKMTRETALWIYHEHSKKELEAKKSHDIVICDRTVFDSFVYAESLGIKFFEYCESQAKDHLYSYDKLFFIRPDIPLIEDGVRSNDLEFQMKVDKLFEIKLNDFNYTEMKSSSIFHKDQTWKHYC